MYNAQKIINDAIEISERNSTTADMKLACQVGYLRATIFNLCDILNTTQDELKSLSQQLNSLGEL